MSETIERDVAVSLPSAEPSMIAGLIAIGKTVRAMMGLKLAEIDLHVGQDELLLALDVAKSLPVSHVAQTLDVRPSTVSKMLDRLVRQGLVNREPGKNDARITMVRITAEGLAKVEQIKQVRGAIDDEINRALRASSTSTTAADIVDLSQVVAARLHRLR